MLKLFSLTFGINSFQRGEVHCAAGGGGTPVSPHELVLCRKHQCNKRVSAVFWPSRGRVLMAAAMSNVVAPERRPHIGCMNTQINLP